MAARLKYAELLIATGDLVDAENLLRELIGLASGYIEARFALGRLLARTGRYQEAIAQFEAVLDGGGNYGPVHYALGVAYRADGDEESARRHFGLFEERRGGSLPRRDILMVEVVALDLSDQRLMQRAAAAADRGQTGEAIALLEHAVEADPDAIPARATLVALYAQVGDYAQSEVAYRAALALDPNLAELHYNLGLARTYQGRHAEAITAFREALETDPHRADIQMQIGRSYESLRQDDAAIEAYRSALVIQPGLRPARLALAKRLVASGRVEAATGHLTQLLEPVDDATPEALYTLASVYLEASREEDAFAALERAGRLVNRSRQAGLAIRIDNRLRQLSVQRKATAREEPAGEEPAGEEPVR